VPALWEVLLRTVVRQNVSSLWPARVMGGRLVDPGSRQSDFASRRRLARVPSLE
jgi:hypothetical protein